MTTLKKYDLSGKVLGEVAVDKESLEVSANPQMMKDYLVAIRKNARQWSANTKDKSEVQASGIKPHKQKGTGRARQGSYVSPQYRGGGRVFGPKPKKDQHVRINAKERRAVIRALIADRIKSERISILAESDIKTPKTKPFVGFLEKLQLKGQRVLFLSSQTDMNFVKSVRNIPRVECALTANLNGYNLALSQNLVVLDSAVDSLLDLLRKEK